MAFDKDGEKMIRYIALLRGINISGKNKISMPELTTAMYVVWRRGQQFNKAADVFLEEMKRVIEGEG